jgi:hypothetical protein
VPDFFLPFSKAAKVIELKAIDIKATYGLAPYDAIDPDDLARRMGVSIVPAEWFDRLDPADREAVLVECGPAWSAGSVVVGGRTHVLLNPGHAETRRSASLGEELMHVALGHPASTLQTIDGVPVRTCRQDVESEAYAVAMALLLPYRAVFNHINGGGELAAIPARVPVSEEARRYRVKTAGLWRLAQARGRARRAASA